VPFDAQGLFEAMGGREAANARLDAFFHNGDGSWALTKSGGLHAEMDNEPTIKAPWLYDYSGRPDKTQQTIRQIVNDLWGDGPGGIPGNDDLGEMSAWYVWAALGMYPMVPGRAELVLASPLFSRIAIRRGNGVNITVNAPQAEDGNFSVQSLRVNGQSTTRPWLPESFVLRGGVLDYTLSAAPHPGWGSEPGDAPPSFPATPR
jgi:putative alpha-1,2-mannosidase